MQGFIYVHLGIEIALLLVENDCQIVESLIKLGIQLSGSLIMVDCPIDHPNIEVCISHYFMHLSILTST